eukprot:738559-Rhodomonas_salina.1
MGEATVGTRGAARKGGRDVRRANTWDPGTKVAVTSHDASAFVPCLHHAAGRHRTHEQRKSAREK